MVVQILPGVPNNGSVAQLVEHCTENAGVGGSTPPGATISTPPQTEEAVMMNLPYPPDGGLRKQVRDYEDTLSAFRVLNDAFFKKQFRQPQQH